MQCSGAPDCSLLNRYPCATTTNTCGKCKGTLFGDEGDSNTICSSSISSSVKKRCPNDCSNNGVCVYININTNSHISMCNTTDVSCYAECQCAAGFSSSACDITTAEQQWSSDYRATMISQIATVAKVTSNPSVNTINGWVGNLVELGIIIIIIIVIIIIIIIIIIS